MVHLNSAVRLLDEAVKKHPKKIAVTDEWGEISYEDMQKLAKSVATELIKKSFDGFGVEPVIVYLQKSLRCIVSFMGAMYSGNPYVPVAYDMPPNRVQKIISSLEGRGHIITDAEGAKKLSELDVTLPVHIYEEITAQKADNEAIERALGTVCDTDPIYIMFTSGSTGDPKGVTVPHRGVIDYAMWVSDTFGINEDTILGNQAPLYFDNSIFDIYSMLLSGAKMMIIPEKLFMFPSKLPEFIEENSVTTIFWVPTVMINVANSGVLSEVKMPTLKTAAFCGEVMPNTQLNIWRREHPDCLYANLYGPTEISDVCTYYIVDREFNDSDPLPIGKACENMRIIILNEENKQAKVNEQGEMCVIGTGVSLGYWNKPEITAKAFTQNPLNPYYNEKIYRTGDLAYINEEGLIMYIGRRDNQVKIKGNRIELGEVENAAMCVSGIKGVCAVVDEKEQCIVLFAESKEELKLRKVNLELKKYIPNYMLPSRLVVMDRFPHTANDKIDRVTLKKSLSDGEML